MTIDASSSSSLLSSCDIDFTVVVAVAGFVCSTATMHTRTTALHSNGVMLLWTDIIVFFALLRRNGEAAANSRPGESPGWIYANSIFRWRMATLSASPMANIIETSELPPALMNGRVRPVTGMSFKLNPTLMTTWKKMSAATPVADSRSELIWRPVSDSQDTPDYHQQEQQGHAAPTDPNSSAITLKMKSVWRTRRKRSWFCVPCIQPMPERPPLPTAINACSTL